MRKQETAEGLFSSPATYPLYMKIESHQTEPEKEKNSTKMCMVLESAIYMVQYASFRKFCSNTQNFQNFDLVVLFIVMHHMCFYISINSRKILGSYRMWFFPIFFCLGWAPYVRPKLGVISKFSKHSYFFLLTLLVTGGDLCGFRRPHKN